MGVLGGNNRAGRRARGTGVKWMGQVVGLCRWRGTGLTEKRDGNKDLEEGRKFATWVAENIPTKGPAKAWPCMDVSPACCRGDTEAVGAGEGRGGCP